MFHNTLEAMVVPPYVVTCNFPHQEGPTWPALVRNELIDSNTLDTDGSFRCWQMQEEAYQTWPMTLQIVSKQFARVMAVLHLVNAHN